MKVNIRHYAFPDYSINMPVDWRIDPYKNKNWVHHFMSLRWISKKNEGEVYQALHSFYVFHLKKKVANKVYNTLRGDHTAAIRLEVLIDIFEMYEGNEKISFIVRSLINQDVSNLQKDDMYRAGHNHGLMVDIALLKAYEFSSFRKKINLENVVNRSLITLEGMWHRDGFTKEHSVSYQEYNLPISIEAISLVKRYLKNDDAIAKMKGVAEFSQKVLGFCLRKNGEYFPLGDSFRKPNKNILSGVYGNGDPVLALHPYSTSKGEMLTKGYYFFRNKTSIGDIHFAATCCWESINHKQNDEGAFCLEVDGEIFFDDPGYTTAHSKEVTSFLKSEEAHSTITIVGKEWGNRAKVNSRSFIEKDINDQKLRMRHSRIVGFNFERIVSIVSNEISIKDTIARCEVGDAEKEVVNYRFVLSPSVNVFSLVGDEVNGVTLILESNGVYLKLKSSVSNYDVSDIYYVGSDKKDLISTKVVDFKASIDRDSKELVNFFFIC